MNILVTGANGQLGNEMRLVSEDTNDSYTFTDVVEVEGVETTLLDITDAEAVRRMVKEKGIRTMFSAATPITRLAGKTRKARPRASTARRSWRAKRT